LLDQYIAEYKTFCTSNSTGCYNLTTGGDHFEFSEVTKKLISKKMKGRILSKEHLKNMSKAMKGHTVSIEGRLNMSLSHIGQKAWNKGKTGIYSEESRKKCQTEEKDKKEENIKRD
jgi:hypothetical protein